MSFWSTARIKKQLNDLIELDDAQKPSDFDVKEAAYELSLGGEAYISGAGAKTVLGDSGMVAIEPGQIAVLITEEKVRIPKDVLGIISLKSSVKFPGLINVSGFHVDPGFHGRLIFTVYNAGTETCAFVRGQKLFLIWFAQLDEPEKREHSGKRQNQSHIKGEDITRLTAEGASPAKLNERLQRLELMGKVYGALLLAFFLSAATMFIQGALTSGPTRSGTGADEPATRRDSPQQGEPTSQPQPASIPSSSHPPTSRAAPQRDEPTSQTQPATTHSSTRPADSALGPA